MNVHVILVVEVLSSMAASKKAARENVSMPLRKLNEFISIGISQRIILHHAHETRFYFDNNASGPVCTLVYFYV